jgi:amino acid transporter
MTERPNGGLAKTLNAFHLWGIAVGLVISGEYFGWSFGWSQAGTLGFLVTTIAVAIMYLAFPGRRDRGFTAARAEKRHSHKLGRLGLHR